MSETNQYSKTQSEIVNFQNTLLNLANENKKTTDSNKDSVEERKNDTNTNSNKIIKKRNNNNRMKSYEVMTSVDSSNVLEFVNEKYKGKRERDSIGMLIYHPFRTGKYIDESIEKQKINDYKIDDYTLPRPFLPIFNLDSINKIVQVKIFYEDWMNSKKIDDVNAPRSNNSEIWGCDIYTDDSDPIIALRHCGFGYDGDNKWAMKNMNLTPVNEENKNNIVGSLPPDEETEFDILLDLLILPSLENYPSVRRYGVNSRSWASELGAQSHDGLSFGIHRIEVTLRERSNSTNGSSTTDSPGKSNHIEAGTVDKRW